MTQEGVTTSAVGAPVADSAGHVPYDADEPMFCYRHPDRETRVRCGRCERPICTRCAMQGPVGFRCRQCGTLAFDPLTSLRPSQALIGFGIAVGLSAVVGFIAWQLGLFGIFISFFAGNLIAEAITRVIGLKHGPQILAVVLSGVVIGTVLGFGLNFWNEYTALYASMPQEAWDQLGITPFQMLMSELAFPLLSLGAAIVGVYSRLR